MADQLRAEFPSWFLTVQIEEMEHAQMKHYAWCAEEQRGNFNWIGFFDLDEYLYINGCAAAQMPSLPIRSIHTSHTLLLALLYCISQ
jgi:hypothetical protein